MKSDDEIQEVVVDGHQWYQGKHAIAFFEKSTLNKFLMGSNDPNLISYTITEDFKGDLSELNIWNKALSSEELMAITNSCGNPEPKPNILNWSEMITISMLTEKNEVQEIGQLCHNSTYNSAIHTIVPHLEDQDGAMLICQILKGHLAYPMSTDEYEKWNSK